jgi:hypothetical protein
LAVGKPDRDDTSPRKELAGMRGPASVVVSDPLPQIVCATDVTLLRCAIDSSK